MLYQYWVTGRPRGSPPFGLEARGRVPDLVRTAPDVSAAVKAAVYSCEQRVEKGTLPQTIEEDLLERTLEATQCILSSVLFYTSIPTV